MQTQVIAAEQASTNRYWQPPPLPPREIELTIRLQIPEGDGADVGIRPSFALELPEPWEDMLHQRLYEGVHAGLASVGTPIPDGGIGVHITRLHLSPPVTSDTGAVEVRRIGDALAALAASTVAALWAGLMSLDGVSMR